MAKGDAKGGAANRASEAWSAPDPKSITERGRYEALVKLLDGSKPQTRRAVVRWVVAAELDSAREAYREVFEASEAYKAKLIRLAGVGTKRVAEMLAEHQRGLELALDVTALAVQIAHSTDAAGYSLALTLESLHALAGPWKDARAGAEQGHGIASLDDDTKRVSRLREQAQVLHERWVASEAARASKRQ